MKMLFIHYYFNQPKYTVDYQGSAGPYHKSEDNMQHKHTVDKLINRKSIVCY